MQTRLPSLKARLNRVMRKAVTAGLRGAPRRHEATAQQPPQYAVDVTFVTDDEMTELNHTYRHKNRSTDVLSFAQSEGESFALSPALNGTCLLGDIVISIETAARQANQLQHDLETEVAFLGVHGTLHLLGYDHITTADRRVMWKWQETIFAAVQS